MEIGFDKRLHKHLKFKNDAEYVIFLLWATFLAAFIYAIY
jgi:hypothetical protein